MHISFAARQPGRFIRWATLGLALALSAGWPGVALIEAHHDPYCYLLGDYTHTLTRVHTGDTNPASNEVDIGPTATSKSDAMALQPGSGVLYAVNTLMSSQVGYLGTLNTATGAFSARPNSLGTGQGELGPVTFYDLSGLAFDPATGTLYASHVRWALGQQLPDVLFQVNPGTGQFVPNAFGQGQDYVPLYPLPAYPSLADVDDIAIHPVTGQMYGIMNNSGGGDRLVRIDKQSGAASDVGAFGVSEVEGLSFDAHGQLWATAGSAPTGSPANILFAVDLQTGAASAARPIDNSGNYEAVACFNSGEGVPTPTASPSPAQEVLIFAPVADAYVLASDPANNYGAYAILRTLATPEQRSYLRFRVAGVGGRTITRATLRLYANGSSSAGYTVRGVGDVGWNEHTLTYNTAPALGSLVNSSGAHGGAQYTQVEVTGYITGDGTFSLAMTTSSTRAVSYPSREATSNRPQLVVEVGPGGAMPTATRTPTSGAPTATATRTGTPTTATPTVTHTPTPAVPTATRTATATQTAPAASPTTTRTPTPTVTPMIATATPTRTPTLPATVIPPVPSSTPPAGGQALSFHPAADAYVAAAFPNTNYGSISILRSLASPEQRSYLRFVVSGIGGQAITRATLRLYANGSSSAGYDVRGVSDLTWSESGVTYASAPALGAVIGSSGAHGGAQYTEVDVTGYVTGDGAHSLALTTSSTKVISYPSREAASNRPELIVEVGPANATSTATPHTTATHTTTATAAAPTATRTPTPAIPTPSPTATPTALPPGATATASPTHTTAAPTASATPTTTGSPPDTPIAASPTPSAPETLVLTPDADAYVAASAPTTNYGASSILRTHVSPEQRSYLRFVVSGVAGRTITHVTLRLYANGSSSLGYWVNAVSDSGWDERAVTYASAPALGPVLASSGEHGGARYTEVDLTGVVTGDGVFAIALTTASDKVVSYPSREATANRPELVVVVGAD
jgi:hypothetical protein